MLAAREVYKTNADPEFGRGARAPRLHNARSLGRVSETRAAIYVCISQSGKRLTMRTVRAAAEKYQKQYLARLEEWLAGSRKWRGGDRSMGRQIEVPRKTRS